MSNHSFELFGRNTLEILPVSYGTLFRKNWELDQHPGPIVDLRLIGGVGHKLLYLYPRHLKLLYERFIQMNPEGVEIEIDGAYEEKWVPSNLTPADVDDLYEKRKIFVNLLLTDSGGGYLHLKKYLPEIFENPVIEEMERDPWLDANLLASTIKSGAVGSPLEDQMDEHPRWSKAWADLALLHKSVPAAGKPVHG